MAKTFTQDDLIRYIYHETTESEEVEISRVLALDQELQLQYRSLMMVKEELDKSRLEPSATATENILRYAHGLEVKQ